MTFTTAESHEGELEWNLGRYTEVRGRLTDETHFPLSGIEVIASGNDGASTPTDDQGRFRIEGIEPGEQILQFLDGETLLGFHEVETQPAGGSRDLGTLRLGETTELWGRVVDRRGQPLADVAIHLDLDSPYRTPRLPVDRRHGVIFPIVSHTAADGTFHLQGLPLGSRIGVGAFREGFVSDAEHVMAEPPMDELVLTLSKLEPLRVKVVSASTGERLTKVHVRVVNIFDPTAGPNGGRRFDSGPSDSDGEFLTYIHPGGRAIVEIKPGSFYRSVGFDMPRYGGFHRELNAEETRDLDELTVELEPENAVAGVIRRPDGRPAVGVQLRPHADSAEHWVIGATTDAEGRFRLEGLDPGSHRYFLKSKELGRHERTVEVTEGETFVEWVLEAPGFHRLEGELEIVGEPPPAGLVLFAINNALAEEWPTVCDPSGAFSFGDLPEGTYQISARRSPFAIVEGSTVVLDRDRDDWQVVLERPRAR
jgi:hypothetical protein